MVFLSLLHPPVVVFKATTVARPTNLLNPTTKHVLSYFKKDTKNGFLIQRCYCLPKQLHIPVTNY